MNRRDILRYALGATVATVVPKLLGAPHAAATGGIGESLNVKDFGAIGDGIANDRAAIHAARDAAGVNGVLHFPPGDYLVSELTANVAGQLWELAPGAVLKGAVGAPQILKVTAPEVTLDGGVWDQSAATTTLAQYLQMCIRIEGTATAGGTTADGCTIRNATVKRAPVHGIYGVGCSRVNITDCKFFDNRGNAAFFIYLINTDLVPNDITITNNLVDNVSAGINYSDNSGWTPAGFGLRPGEHYNDQAFTKWGARYKVTGNTIRMSPRVGNMAGGGLELMNCRGMLVSDNAISGGHIGISIGNPHHCVVSGNSVKGFDGIGIELGGDTRNCTISGNTIDPDGVARGAGIQSSYNEIQGGGPGMRPRIMKDTTISGNIFRTFPEGPSSGIDMNKDVVYEGLSITGNTITSSVASGKFNGIQFINSFSAEDVMITGNVIDANSTAGSRGVEFLTKGAVTGVTVIGNQFKNLAVSAVTLGTGIGATYDDIYVLGNDVQNTPKQIDGAGVESGTNVVHQ